jgi:NAD(P)H-hydrate epimerase
MDRVAIEEFGVPGVVLMENAGAGAAAVARRVLHEKGEHVSILAGKGNNGGDAFVVARHLLNRGIAVSCTYIGALEEADPNTDPGVNLYILFKMGLLIREIHNVEGVEAVLRRLEKADLIIDGMLGTGARGRVREPYASLIQGVNQIAVPVLALDLPSGLDADTGEVLGHCIQAAHTTTFALPKQGFDRNRGPDLCGEVHIIDIGMPRKVVKQVLASMREA